MFVAIEMLNYAYGYEYHAISRVGLASEKALGMRVQGRS